MRLEGIQEPLAYLLKLPARIAIAPFVAILILTIGSIDLAGVEMSQINRHPLRWLITWPCRIFAVPLVLWMVCFRDLDIG